MSGETPYDLHIEYDTDGWVAWATIDGQEVNARGLNLDVTPERYILWVPLIADAKRPAITLLLQSDSTTSRDNKAIAAILELPNAIARLVAQDKAWHVGELLQLTAGHNAQHISQVGDRDVEVMDSRIRHMDVPNDVKTTWNNLRMGWYNAASRLPTPSLFGDDDDGLYGNQSHHKPAGTGEGLSELDIATLNDQFQPSRGPLSRLRDFAAGLARLGK